MENEETTQSFAASVNNDSQYNNLSFGGTLDNTIPESDNEGTQSNTDVANQPNIEMHINCDLNQLQRESETSISQQIPSTPADMTKSHENTQPLTTENTCTNGAYINAYDYSCRLLEKLHQIVNELKPTLTNIHGTSEDADCLLNNLQIGFSQHSNMVFQKPLETLADILQLGSDILYQSGQINSAFLPGEESGGISEQRIVAPREENNDQLNEQLQAPTESNLPTTSNDNSFATLPMSLSQLMAQVRNVVEELELIELVITEQPQEFWKKRSINCLKQKWCPAVQGRSGKQRHYVKIKWSELNNYDSDNLFIFVQLLSVGNEPHSSNILVPPGTTVQLQESLEKKRKRNDNRRPKLDDLVIKDKHGFDRKSNTIICPVTEEEYKTRTKNLNVIMFRLYQTSEEIIDEDDEDEENISIEEKLLKLCKMRICLCRRINGGELKYASNFVDTALIEESKGNKPLAVDLTEITPQYLCNCGNEVITVPLNTDSEKHGFDVRFNDRSLKFHEIRGVKNKQISFNSTPNTVPGQDYLNVKVFKESISETIKQNHDPYNGLDQIRLVNVNLPYVPYSNNPHVHKDTQTEDLIDLIE